MRSILKKTLGRGSEDQKGFTLIELLVVVGIIVALAAVIVPLVIQFAGRGEVGAASAEWDAIQSAIDTMMADNTLITVTAGSTSAFITDTLDFEAGSGTQFLDDYLRDPSTVYCYTWEASGRITAQVAATGTPPAC
ncbi:MAG: prepilin-type N-terminal cleavage/methylation domain-containing protein [Chloroflexi bacterium]|nr:prepilin-type N-terminal cleavage/methylation domain-containing protein [Chloroflexota bacterium]